MSWLRRFVDRFQKKEAGAEDDAAALAALEAAYGVQDSDAFEDAWIRVCHLGRIESHSPLADLIIRVLREDWHTRHEDLVQSIHWDRVAGAEEILEYRTEHFPAYLKRLDNGYALARKCTWALADIGGARAHRALKRIANREDPVIAEFAEKRLRNW
ncbi:hypothetical protein J7443_03735 [Tropicibacter sp. R15_0]|uniref:hypothetical protein n=1 Tax=Tropicibacter sp. R15_0 TaxID=2821101 RepID=UPI001ADA1623|nr:hypothetical protein [Tropicibacter sp. R15_0]MBO9464330.1 hypothetical protein [Tropicibacter sp. R15_0]